VPERSSDIPPYAFREGMNPVPELRRMAAETPLLRHTGDGTQDWIATGREEVRAVMGDSDAFTTRPPAATVETSRRLAEPGNLLHHDPPDHTRLRKMLAAEFTMRRTRRMDPLIDRIVAERLDMLERAGQPADLMRHFAKPVAALVACSLLGVPRDDQAELTRILEIRAAGVRQKNLTAVKSFNAYLGRLVSRRRGSPGDDLLGMLIKEHGDELSDRELVGICGAIMSGGFEAPSEMLGLGILALLERPDQWELLKQRPELMERAVEELLRYVAVVSTASPRTAVRRVELAGQVVSPGEVVGCSLFAANRAQAVDEAQDALDITREPGPHLAFGHGIHRCVGAALARTELAVAYAGLLGRFPGLRLAVPREQLRFKPRSPQYGVEALPVAW
jgi:cytochrome P450